MANVFGTDSGGGGGGGDSTPNPVNPNWEDDLKEVLAEEERKRKAKERYENPFMREEWFGPEEEDTGGGPVWEPAEAPAEPEPAMVVEPAEAPKPKFAPTEEVTEEVVTEEEVPTAKPAPEPELITETTPKSEHDNTVTTETREDLEEETQMYTGNPVEEEAEPVKPVSTTGGGNPLPPTEQVNAKPVPTTGGSANSSYLDLMAVNAEEARRQQAVQTANDQWNLIQGSLQAAQEYRDQQAAAEAEEAAKLLEAQEAARQQYMDTFGIDPLTGFSTTPDLDRALAYNDDMRRQQALENLQRMADEKAEQERLADYFNAMNEVTAEEERRAQAMDTANAVAGSIRAAQPFADQMTANNEDARKAEALAKVTAAANALHESQDAAKREGGMDFYFQDPWAPGTNPNPIFQETLDEVNAEEQRRRDALRNVDRDLAERRTIEQEASLAAVPEYNPAYDRDEIIRLNDARGKSWEEETGNPNPPNPVHMPGILDDTSMFRDTDYKFTTDTSAQYTENLTDMLNWDGSRTFNDAVYFFDRELEKSGAREKFDDILATDMMGSIGFGSEDGLGTNFYDWFFANDYGENPNLGIAKTEVADLTAEEMGERLNDLINSSPTVDAWIKSVDKWLAEDPENIRRLPPGVNNAKDLFAYAFCKKPGKKSPGKRTGGYGGYGYARGGGGGGRRYGGGGGGYSSGGSSSQTNQKMSRVYNIMKNWSF